MHLQEVSGSSICAFHIQPGKGATISTASSPPHLCPPNSLPWPRKVIPLCSLTSCNLTSATTLPNGGTLASPLQHHDSN